MITTIVFWIVTPILVGTSLTLLYLIIDYLKNKPPAYQTILDHQIIDTSRIVGASTVVFACPVMIVFSYQVNYYFGVFVIIAGKGVYALLLVTLQATITLKAILIFKSEIIEEYQDQVLLTRIRVAVFCSAFLIFIFDLICFEQPTETAQIVYTLTGVEKGR